MGQVNETREVGSDSAECHLPIEYAADLTPVVEGKEAGASWNARGMEKTVDFWSRKEYSVRASGRTPGKIAGHDQGTAARSTGVGRNREEPVGEALGQRMKGVAFSAGMAADLAVVEDQGQGIGQKPDHGQHH
jgi:hypothetical protein